VRARIDPALSPTDRSLYVKAVEVLRSLGVPLNVALLEYVSAVKGLPERATPHFFVRFPLSAAVGTMRRDGP
jgi:hypothetical protein